MGIQKKEEELKEKEATEPQKASEKQTDRQKEAVLAQKEKEEKDRLRKEEIQRSIAYDTERELMNRVAELRHKAGPHCLGRDRAYRRFLSWNLCPDCTLNMMMNLSVNACPIRPKSIRM